MKKFTTELSSKKEEYGDIIVTVHDKQGNLLQRVDQVVDSFNDQLWKVLHQTLVNAASGTLRDLSNNSDTFQVSPISRVYDALLNSYSGIVVGTGSNPTTISKNIMDSLVVHGSGSGQLEAQVSTVEFDATNGISTLTRPFVNVSSDQGTITINEVGIAFSGTESATTTNAYLAVRDVLASSVNVPYEATLAVQYKVRISQGTNNYKNVFIRPFGLSTTSNTLERYGLTNITNVYVSTLASSGIVRITSTEGQTNRGLVFGTSNGAFAVTQNDLLGKIAHGNSAGQLFYHSTTNGTFDINTTTNSLSFKFFRSVENRSGSNISIYEAGIFSDGGAAVAGVQSFMLDRRVIDPPVTITNGNIISFTWEFCYEV